jgi:hypothetical protein
MAKYFLFSGLTYYPVGGVHDLVGSWDTVEEALENVIQSDDWWHIYDLDSGKIVASGTGDMYDS